MEGEEKQSVYDRIVQWVLANGKEASAFVIVMAAAVIMFQRSLDEARESRAQQWQQQGELVKELRERELRALEREARAWEVRAKDRGESIKHAESMGTQMEKLAGSVDELIRTMKGKSKLP